MLLRGVVLSLMLMLLAGPAKAEDYCADANTTPEINACTQEEYEDVAAKLETAVIELRKMAVDIDAESEGDYKVAERLDTAQAAFKTYADASCEFAAATYTNGSGATAAYNGCMTKLTQQRLEIINSELPH